MKNIYVGNLPFDATATELEEAFGQYGAVAQCQVANDRETGRSRGFGFVEMSNGGEAAIAALNGASFGGRTADGQRGQAPRGPAPQRRLPAPAVRRKPHRESPARPAARSTAAGLFSSRLCRRRSARPPATRSRPWTG